MTTALASAPALTALDRCDRCGAQALVRAVLPYGELLFCGHHGRQHADALARVAVSVDTSAPSAA
jgi:hypothetical protein